MSDDAPGASALPTSVPLLVGGQEFTLFVYADPSGLRGQVFDGQEKLAGVQVFHTQDVKRLVGLAMRDRAVLRAVARRTQPEVQPC